MYENCAVVKKTRIRPVIRELSADVDTPISVYLKLRGLGPSFLLESVEGGEHLARYSMIGAQPKAILRSFRQEDGRVRAVYEEEGHWESSYLDDCDVLDALRERMPSYDPADIPEGLPRFTGGAVGYMGYDMVRSFERLPDAPPDTRGLPEALFMLCDRLVIYDHVKHRLLVIAHVDAENGSMQAAEAALDEMVARLRRPVPQQHLNGGVGSTSPSEGSAYASHFDQGDYEEAVRRAKHYIHEGDIFQTVLSRCVSRQLRSHPFDVYRALRQINPSPYMVYLELPDGLRLVASSPEVLVRVDDGIIETRPLAGTRPRGATPAEDDALAVELLADPKERAEHVMLVDLARNDLGRVCDYGTVHTTQMLEIERYSHVMHIVSNVQGQLSPERDALDVLKACFPAGTLSGAPKVRAMEIIDELEPQRRGPYGGAMGYLSFSGNLDTCITIRTIVVQGDRAYLQAGAGIVADSDPTTEFHETENKLRALARAIDLAESQTRGGLS